MRVVVRSAAVLVGLALVFVVLAPILENILDRELAFVPVSTVIWRLAPVAAVVLALSYLRRIARALEEVAGQLPAKPAEKDRR